MFIYMYIQCTRYLAGRLTVEGAELLLYMADVQAHPAHGTLIILSMIAQGHLGQDFVNVTKYCGIRLRSEDPGNAVLLHDYSYSWVTVSDSDQVPVCKQSLITHSHFAIATLRSLRTPHPH